MCSLITYPFTFNIVSTQEGYIYVYKISQKLHIKFNHFLICDEVIIDDLTKLSANQNIAVYSVVAFGSTCRSTGTCILMKC